MDLTAAAAVGTALALDALFEEFPRRVHPVALFGRVVDGVDRPWSAPGVVGALVAVCLPLGAAASTWALVMLSAASSPILGGFVAALVLFGATSLRMLIRVAATVVDLAASDATEAREAVVALVGRETVDLSAGELRSAAVESTAENLADGLVGPLMAFAIGVQWSLALGAAGAVWVKTVNTLDSVLGYRSRAMGRASARLDDAVMWLPARVAAGLIAVAGGSPRALGRARAWRREPSSPNSGWPMATLAAVLDVRLEKPGGYVLNPDAPLPTHERARAGLDVVVVAGALAFLLTGVVAWL